MRTLQLAITCISMSGEHVKAFAEARKTAADFCQQKDEQSSRLSDDILRCTKKAAKEMEKHPDEEVLTDKTSKGRQPFRIEPGMILINNVTIHELFQTS